MALSMFRRAMASLPKYKPLDVLRVLLLTLLHVLRMCVSFVLLPLDNAILLGTYFVGHLVLPRSIANRRRRAILRDVHFHPKTILVTGINSPHGLALSRCWYYEGHRVVGADVTDFPIRSGESMSKALAAFYDISKTQYISRLLDVINREKVDVWIPCSEQVDVTEDAVAKQVIESRTECRCIQLDPELASRFGSSESFTQYLVEKGLPVVENHQVQSRDSVHKILHRSPSKTYLMRRLEPADQSDQRDNSRVVALPKRTLSLTYSEVSEIQITKDNPWVLQQQTRLGEFYAELLVVRGHVKAIKIRPGDRQSAWGASRLDHGLASAIHRLMDRFAMRGGSRLTSHLCVRVMVDEEFEPNSVRHVVHIADCTQGVAAMKTLFQGLSSAIVSGYLSLLSPQVSEGSSELSETVPGQVETSIAPAPRRGSLHSKDSANLKALQRPPLSSAVQQLEGVFSEARQLPFWRNSRFSYMDPLPWWWHAHIYTPFREFAAILRREPLEQA